MLQLVSLTFSGIGRFVEPQTVDISTLGNLIQVDGENRNTKGSSGSGKTTVFNALDYLLGLNDLPTTVLQSRLTKEPISVRGAFDFNGKPLLITRNKRGLIIDLDGQVTEGSSKLSEEKLDQILGMPRDMFRQILHKRQKEGGFFLKLTPKEMYAFLTDCLNLNETKKKLETVENELKKLETSKINYENELNKAKSALLATQESVLSLGLAPVRDIHQSVILELKSKMDASSSALAKLIEEHKNQNSILDSQRPQLLPNPVLETIPQLENPVLLDTSLDNMSTITLLEAQIHALNKEIKDLEEKEHFRIRQLKDSISSQKMTVQALSHKCLQAQAAKEEAIKVAGEIKKIRAAICPTCEQSWITEAAKTHENDLMTKLNQYKEQISNGLSSEQVIAELQREISIMEQQLEPQGLDIIMSKKTLNDQYNGQIAEERKKAEEYKKEMTIKNMDILAQHASKQKMLAFEVSVRNDALLADVSTKNKVAQDQYQLKTQAVREMQIREMDQARGQSDIDKKAFEVAVNKLKMYEDARVRYESSMTAMKQKEAHYQAEIDGWDNYLRQNSYDLLMATELKKALKTFLSCSFDDALEAIGDGATKIIRCIPTMSNATIQFEGQKETKDGKVKEEVNAVLSMDGDIGIPIKSLSGGEHSSVDLAVDLSVIDFIESETGKGINVFILDEPFTGLDTVSIEMALEVLKNSNSTKKLIVVDHNPEVKQMVSNRLVVVRDGNFSTITNSEVNNG